MPPLISKLMLATVTGALPVVSVKVSSAFRPPMTTSLVAPGTAPFAQASTDCQYPEEPAAKTAPTLVVVSRVWPLPPVAKWKPSATPLAS